MEKNTTKQFLVKDFLIIFFWIVFVLAISLCLGSVILNNLYSKFRTEDSTARQKLGELNMSIFTELPPPPDGAVQGEYYNNGGLGTSTYHGNYLISEYRFEATPNVIFNYYKPFFDKHGWEQSEDQSDSQSKVYFRGTSCIEVDTAFTQFFHGYTIWIWNDYKKQVFTPYLPPFFEIFEFGETYFDTCPP